MSMRAVPLCCPYCAEEELEPYGDVGGYYCGSCDRRFELKFLGLGELESAPEVHGSQDARDRDRDQQEHDGDERVASHEG